MILKFNNVILESSFVEDLSVNSQSFYVLRSPYQLDTDPTQSKVLNCEPYIVLAMAES